MSGNTTTSRWITHAAKIGISAVLLWLLFSRVDLARLVSAARRSSPGWLVAGVVSYSIAVLASSWRWHRLLKIQRVDMSLRAVTESSVVALFFNNFLPTNIGGDVMRIRDTVGPAGSSARAATVVLVDRVIGLLGLVMFAAVGVAASANGRLPVSAEWIWALFIAGCLAVVALLLIPVKVCGWIRPVTQLMGSWAQSQIDALASALVAFRESPSGLLAAFMAALVVQGAFIGVYIAVARALEVPVGAWDMAIIVPLSGVLQMVPVSINGFGVREAAFTIFFTRLGLPRESALLVSLESTALIMGFSILGAVFYIARRSPERTSEPVVAITPPGLQPNVDVAE
ncbi:MAG TPA: lysylphosphatidylglycerol synthase transmembrane domain-containing protein [Vicinamibacterales bacterium]|jgi:hypothetical protein